MTEIQEGRGFKHETGVDCMKLDLRHIKRDLWQSKFDPWQSKLHLRHIKLDMRRM